MMANNYNVDDILAEVQRKKGSAKNASLYSEPMPEPERSKPSAKSKKGSTAPFQLKGMTGEFDVPKRSKSSFEKPGGNSPFAKSPEPAEKPIEHSAEVTRTDLPTNRAASAGTINDKTRVIPAVRPQNDDGLQLRRQEKIQKFMQSSFSAIEKEQQEAQFESDSAATGDDDADSDRIEGISQYFVGLRHSRTLAAQAPEEKKAASDVKQKPAKKAKKAREEVAPPRASSKAKKVPVVEEDEEGEYISPSDARDVRYDILGIKRSLSTRLLVTGGCVALLLYLALCNLYPLPLFNPICPEEDMRVFLMVNLVVFVIGALAANAVIGGGLVSLFTLKADHDTPAALCALAVIAHGVTLIMNPDQIHTGESSFYFVIAALTLFANTIGKRMMILRIERNFAVASVDAQRIGEYLLSGDKLADKLAEGQGFSEPAIAYPVKVSFPEKFLKLSYSDDYSENFSRYIAPIFLLFAVGLSLVCWLVFDRSLIEAFTIFSVVLCMASPLTPTIVGNLPLLRAAKSLSGEGAFISGYDAVETFEDMNCIVVDSGELYPTGAVEMHGIKAFAQSRIDEAILDAASLMCQVDGLLKNIFMEMIGNKSDILKPVTDVVYKDGKGLSARVDGKTVLIGNRALMSAHSVEMPSHDYEKKYVKGDREILYLANSGEVTAMFVLSYRPNPEVAKWLRVLAKKELSLIVHATDPNITPHKISTDYHYPEEFIQVIPSDLRERYLTLTAPKERAKAYIMSLAGTAVRLRALAAIHTLKQAMVVGTVLQMAGLVLGYALVAFLAFTGAMSAIGFGQLAIYQLFWAIAIMLIPNLKKI